MNILFTSCAGRSSKVREGTITNEPVPSCPTLAIVVTWNTFVVMTVITRNTLTMAIALVSRLLASRYDGTYNWMDKCF